MGHVLHDDVPSPRNLMNVFCGEFHEVRVVRDEENGRVGGLVVEGNLTSLWLMVSGPPVNVVTLYQLLNILKNIRLHLGLETCQLMHCNG